MTGAAVKNTSVLLMAQNYELLAPLGKYLRNYCKVLTATDIPQLLKMLSAKQPALIIADCNSIDLVDFVSQIDTVLSAGNQTLFIVRKNIRGNELASIRAAKSRNFIRYSTDVPELSAVAALLKEQGLELKEIQNQRKILIAEDNELNARYMQEVISVFNSEVVHCDDGASALKTFLKEKFDLVITDINLPVVDGFSLSSEISKNSKIPVIGVSGYQEPEIKQKAIEHGMKGFVVKPFDAEELLATISKLTGWKITKAKPTPIALHHKKYDYSGLTRLSNGNKADITTWVRQFIEEAERVRAIINGAFANNMVPPKKGLFHGVLNYSSYFGLIELNEMIGELTVVLSENVAESVVKRFYKKIEEELQDAVQFYQNEFL